MSEHLPAGFAELPEEEQRRIRDTSRAIGELTYAHTGGLIIGNKPSQNGSFNSGSCFVLETGGRFWLATADHVIRFYEDAVAADQGVLLQVGVLQLDLTERELVRSPSADTCLVSLASVEVAQTRLPSLSAPAGWPPPRPKEGDFVAVCGFPAFVRERPSQREVEFNALTAIFRVTAVADHHCSCVWERDEFIAHTGAGAPPEGTELGGMSGGPVLLLGGIAFPLIGVVSEFQSTFEILRIGLFRTASFHSETPAAKIG